MKSNSKEVRSLVVEYINNEFYYLDYEGCSNNNQKIRSQIDYMLYKNETVENACIRYVKEGNFLISYQDMRDFINSLNLNNKKNKEFSDDEVFDMYVYLVSKELIKMYYSK